MAVAAPERLYYTDSDEANELLATDPLALLFGFALDQQVTVPTAFLGPLKIKQRLGTLAIATRDPAEVEKSTSLRADEVSERDAKALRARVKEMADAGVRHFILGLSAPFDRAVLRRFAKEIAEPLRSA